MLTLAHNTRQPQHDFQQGPGCRLSGQEARAVTSGAASLTCTDHLRWVLAQGQEALCWYSLHC